MALPNTYPTTLNNFINPTSVSFTDDTNLYLDEVITQLQQHSAAVETMLGSTPGVNDRMIYVRLSDGAGKGIWMPVSSVAGVGLIRNGNMQEAQRTAGAVVTSTTTYNNLTSYCVDGFFVRPAGASVTQQRGTTVPNSLSPFSLQINGAASVTTVDAGQRIYTNEIHRWYQSLVFSAYVHNVTGQAFTPLLRIDTPSVANTFGTKTNRLSQALQSCPDNAWTLVHHVFDPSAYTNLANGAEIYLQVPTGIVLASDVVRVAQFDVRAGTQYMGYIPPDPKLNLLHCLMYYERMGGAGLFDLIATGKVYATTNAQVTFPIAPKWVDPSFAFSAAADWALQNSAAVLIACSALVGGAIGMRASLGCTVASGLVAGDATSMLANSTASARIHLLTE